MSYSKEEKAMWLEDWKQSGKAIWAYARENGLKPQTFYQWVKKEQQAAESPASFVEVPVPAISAPANRMQEILIEKGDVKIHIPLVMGSSELREFMEWLGAAL